jgi:uncharacterized protein (DUF1778 family)
MNNTLEREIRDALNRASAENGSNTPDFILAQYLTASLNAFNDAVVARANWYGHEDGIIDKSRVIHL